MHLAALWLTCFFAAAPAAEPGFVRLFPGDRLAGWVEEQHSFFTRDHKNARTWSVKDGVVRCDGSLGNCGFLRYEKPLADFTVRMEYCMTPGCNSGVGIRARVPYTTLNPNTLPSNVGFEVQILDDAGQPAAVQSSGSFYGVLAPRANAARPAGQWNELEIECRGPRVRVTLNGQLVQDVDQDQIPGIAPRPQSGYLSLQNHGHSIQFRNVRVREFSSSHESSGEIATGLHRKRGVGGSLSAVSVKPAFQRRGFYLHGCWVYDYPFAVGKWQRQDYAAMFQLLKRLGFNTVMLWPRLEAVPMPLSPQDAQAVREYRTIIDDAQKTGLECWLTLCAAVGSRPEIAAKPLRDRSLYSFMQTVRLDDPKQAGPYFKHREALLEIVNNADGYVTIDGDPGSYPGAKPEDFLKVFLADRRTLDRVGTHPQKQKLIPWIWCGWGGTSAAASGRNRLSRLSPPRSARSRPGCPSPGSCSGTQLSRRPRQRPGQHSAGGRGGPDRAIDVAHV